jgi:chromosome segregation ATPase
MEQLEKQERDAGIREEAYRDLERQFAVLDSNKDKDTKLLLDEINNKDKQIFDLQKQMEAKVEDIGAEHAKLADNLQAEKAIQAELRSRLQVLEASTTPPSSRDTSILSIESVKDGISPRSSIMTVTELTPPDSPATPNDARTSRAHQNMTPAADDNEHRDHIAQLEEALKDLATRCADAESRYTDAQGEIQELRTQLNEAKLIHEEMDDVVPNSAVSRSASMDDISENGSSTMLQTPRTASPSVSPVRRHADLKRESLPAMGVRDLKIGGKDFQKGRGSGDIKRRSVPDSSIRDERKSLTEWPT